MDDDQRFEDARQRLASAVRGGVYLKGMEGGMNDEAYKRSRDDARCDEMVADLKLFWGPQICRLEYLVHLMDTGRVYDEHYRPFHELPNGKH